MWRAIGIILSSGLLFSTPAATQSYPSRTVTIVMPYAAGGGSDVVTRVLAQKLAERLGQSVVVENRVGAGGAIAANFVAKSAPDGLTLFAGTDAQLAIQPSLRKSLPFNPTNDFVPIAMIGFAPFGLLVSIEHNINSVQELITLARLKPGSVSYGSSGVGGASHLVTELFMSMSATKLTHIPYKGNVQGLNDVVAGHIPMIFTGLPPVPALLKGGKVRLLAVTSKDRVATLPEIPTIAEAGVPGFEAVPWVMLVAPAGTPVAIVDRLRKEMADIQALDDVKSRYRQSGYDIAPPANQPQLETFIRAEAARWQKVIQDAGLAHSE